MSMASDLFPPRPGKGSDLLATGFGTAVAMWAVGYVLRLPGVAAPSWLVFTLLLVCLLGGGVVAGRLTPRGWRGGLGTGSIAGLLNLLILGSLLGGDAPGRVVPGALWWVPGSLLLSAAIGAAGGLVGEMSQRDRLERTYLASRGPAAFAWVAAGATFLLLIAGGVVTSKEAGLAVVDWPNSYGYNMFLYPLARMTGGIYYEHVHRLLGSLVGLTTLVLALHLPRVDERRWVRGLGVLALVLVITQGILGGLRVTGHFTLSDDPGITRPNLLLAVLHGVLGQIFFGTMVVVAVVTTPRWRAAAPQPIPAGAADLALALALPLLLVVQLVLGAVLRHTANGLLVHITMAVVVIVAGVLLGVRIWARHGDRPPLGRLATGLITVLGLQLVLGLAALVATGFERVPGDPPLADVLLTTAHQATGAVLLAWSVALALWTFRLVRPQRLRTDLAARGGTT
ncbi:MAG: COX15/CtaA family protein [Candidatus Krumholzibacteriia bacterium]